MAQLGRAVALSLLVACVMCGCGRSHEPSKHNIEFLKKYESLHLRTAVTQALKDAQLSSAAEVGGVLGLSFTARGREFTLQLHQQRGLFTSSAMLRLLSKDGTQYRAIDKTLFHVGIVSGEVNSRVHGSFKDGLFRGVMHIGSYSYYVEPAYLYGNITMQSDHDTIVYEKNDVVYPHPIKHPCPASASPRLRKIQESARPLAPNPLEEHSRSKRDFDITKKTCHLALLADFSFFTAMGADTADVVAEMTFHINEATQMFAATEFTIPSSGDDVAGINFQIGIIDVYTDAANRLSEINSADAMLTAFAAMDYDSVCLAHLFLYRDFDGGLLGLAWVASAGSSLGGICQKRARTAEGFLNLNTGFTTTLNFGSRVPRSISSITTTHEFGHNFGSQHDPTGVCAPGGSQGNYIMYASATDGAKPNNRLFSSCSRTSIAPVLDAKASCFDVRREESSCGNGVREGTEECDCGSEDPETCRKADPCCRPGNCTLLLGMPCSAVWDVCCEETNGTCELAGLGRQCSFVDECQFDQFCNGRNKSCLPAPSPEGSLCNGNASTCRDSSCSGSLCAVYGVEACECTAAGKECDVCCTVDGACWSLKDLRTNSSSSINITTNVLLASNSPCKDYTGYCQQRDADGERVVVCVTVNNDNPLDDLKNILDAITVGSIVEWLKKHWPETLGGFGGAIVLFILLRVTYRPKKLEKPDGDRGLEESVPLLSRRV